MLPRAPFARAVQLPLRAGFKRRCPELSQTPETKKDVRNFLLLKEGSGGRGVGNKHAGVF